MFFKIFESYLLGGFIEDFAQLLVEKHELLEELGVSFEVVRKLALEYETFIETRDAEEALKAHARSNNLIIQIDKALSRK